MAKLRLRHRDPKNKKTKINVIRSEKGVKLYKKLKLVTVLLIISLIINGYLLLNKQL